MFSGVRLARDNNPAVPVRSAGHAFHFVLGEGLHTGSSHKFTPQRLAAIAECAGWSVEDQWLDDDLPYGLFLLSLA